MKLNMDWAREILLQIEADPAADGNAQVRVSAPEGCEPNQLQYHLKLLHEAGFIEARVVGQSSMSPAAYHPKCLTWEGHQFLDESRKDSVWQKAKKIAIEQSGGLSMAVLRQALLQVITG